MLWYIPKIIITKIKSFNKSHLESKTTSKTFPFFWFIAGKISQNNDLLCDLLCLQVCMFSERCGALQYLAVIKIFIVDSVCPFVIISHLRSLRSESEAEDWLTDKKGP